MKTLKLLFVVLCCVGLVDGLALAAKGKKKKKKKAVAEEASGQAAEGEVAAAPSAGGDHGAQDKPGPYGHELSMGFRFASNSVTPTVDGEDGDAVSSTEITLSAKYHYLLGMMGPGVLGVGPILAYTSTSYDESSSSGFTVGASAIYFLGELDTAAWLPYVEANFGFKSSSSETEDANGDAVEAGESGMTVNVNGGIYYFLDAGVAATAGAFFDWSSTTIDDSDPEASNTLMAFGVTAGMSTFF